jgi:aldose 1-epimerase
VSVNELRISDGSIEVVLLPQIGARLHRLRAFGHDLLRTPADPATHTEDPFFWGSYVMAPWCNRIDANPVRVDSHRVALRANFPDGTAIHGQVYARPWDVLEDGTLRVRSGGDGWPWAYEVGQRIEVVDDVVRIELALTNLADDPMPAGLGIHPWFRRPLLLAIRGDRVHRSNTESKPWPERVSGPFDLRAVGTMADDLDGTWSDLTQPPVELRWPAQHIRVVMRTVSPTSYVVAASPRSIDAIAVEPETHAPQGLRRMLGDEPGGLTRLDPGRTLRLQVELAFDRLDPGSGNESVAGSP